MLSPTTGSLISGYLKSFIPRQSIAPSLRLKAWVKHLRLLQARHKQRRALLTLSDAQLKDIGISRYDATIEGQKPFWKV